MKAFRPDFSLPWAWLLPPAQPLADDTAANLRLMAFGSDAQLTAVKHAIERFNQKYPNVKVEIAIDPISNGWGDYVTHVLSQFNAGNAYDVYGTAIETFRTFEERGLFMPLDDYIAKNAAIPISIPRCSNIPPIRERPISFRSDGTTS